MHWPKTKPDLNFYSEFMFFDTLEKNTLHIPQAGYGESSMLE